MFRLSAVPLYSIAIAFLLLYVPFMVVAVARLQLGYNYSAPRTMFDKLPPYAQRATWAHQNAFESYAPFAAAALVAYIAGVEGPWAMGLSAGYLIARLLYAFFYIADWPYLRSLMWGIGILCTGGLFALSFVTL